jgi:hypothetical protein
MAARKLDPGKKYFTPAQANAMLPLVRQIIRDITELAGELRRRQEHLAGLDPRTAQDERLQAEAEFERGRERMEELVGELRQLGVELKDFFAGLVDFPCWMDGREVYLCWKQGEPEVAHWHEVDAGFAGRQKLLQAAR